MTAFQLRERRLAKPWGRSDLPPPFADAADGAARIGEIWFEHPEAAEAALLVKFLFTSERLSIQVHPNDNQARAAGLPRGKDEAWLILDADQAAEIGIGLTRQVDPAALEAAARDGSIVDLMDWRPARKGDFYYSPAGTVHALGPGLVLVEVQQNVDVTYRLFDYGRPRELHLADGMKAARPGPYRPAAAPYDLAAGRTILAEGGAFVLERWTAPLDPQPRFGDEPSWFIILSGEAILDGQSARPGSVWWCDGPTEVRLGDAAELLIAYEGGVVRSAA